MVGRKTIVVEDRLKAIFNYIPDFTDDDNNDFKVVFRSGTHKELIAWLKQNQQTSNYPLIWLEQPYEETHINRKRVKLDQMKLVLAVETNSAMLSGERLETTFKPFLYKLVDYIIDVLTVSNISSIPGEFKITKFENFSDSENGEIAKITDLWDAIKLTVDIELNDNCLREIKI